MSTEMLDRVNQLVFVLGMDNFRRSEGRLWFAIVPGGNMQPLPDHQDDPYMDVWIEPASVPPSPTVWIHFQGGEGYDAVRLCNPTFERMLSEIRRAVEFMEHYGEKK
jgi:hypothetical protein